MGLDEPDGRPSGPSGAALAALVLDSPERARRALTFAIENRGLPLPNAPDPGASLRVGLDGRRSVPGRADVACAAGRQRADAIRSEHPTRKLGLLRERQCEDGGWNYGNATVYDVDLRGYAQTTAIALIALQGAVERSFDRRWASCADSGAGSPAGSPPRRLLLAFRLHGADDASPAGVEHSRRSYAVGRSSRDR